MMKDNVLFVGHGDLMLDKIYDHNHNIIREEGGGCNWNVLYNLAYSGEKCYAIGGIGNDEDGNKTLESLNKVGINTEYVIREAKGTNVMNIIIPDSKNIGDNDVVHTWYSPITNKLTINFSNKLPSTIPEELKDKQLYIILDRVRKVNLNFINNIEHKKVCLDVGHIRYIRHFDGDYLKKFLLKANLLLLNMHTSKMLYNKLGIEDEVELFNILKLDLLVITNGKNKSTFMFRKNKEVEIIHKQPKLVREVVDTSGAGDAFFASIIKHYAYNGKVNSEFIDKVFEEADLKARETLKFIGSRREKK